MSPMIDESKDDLIIIVEDSKQELKKQNLPAKSPTTPKSILKNSKSNLQSKSFDQPSPKQPILKRHSFDGYNPSSNTNASTNPINSNRKTTHSILKHSHSNTDDTVVEDDQRQVKPILKKNKSFENFKERSDESIHIKPILKKKDEHRSD